MNRLKFLLAAFVVAILTLSIYSCGKEDNLTENQVNKNDQTNISQEYLQLVDLNSSMATFKSEDDFAKFMEILPTLSQQQKEELVSQTQFTTVEEHLEYLYEQLDLIDDRQLFINFVSQNSEFLEISVNEFGDEEVIEKEISLDPSALIHNVDRIIKVKDTYYKFIGDIQVECKDYNTLKLIKSKKDAENSRLDCKLAYKVLGYSESSRWTDLNKMFSLQAENNQSGCKNDRRVKFSWGLLEFTDKAGDIIGKRIHLITEIHPTKKGIPCIWYKYKTLITRNNFNFAGNIRVTSSTLSTSFNITKPNTAVEASGLDSNDFLFAFIPIGNQKAEACFTLERVDVTTRGMGGFWINLNQSSICM